MKKEEYIEMLNLLDLSFYELEKLENKIQRKIKKGVGDIEELKEYLRAVNHVSLTKALQYYK